MQNNFVYSIKFTSNASKISASFVNLHNAAVKTQDSFKGLKGAGSVESYKLVLSQLSLEIAKGIAGNG